MTYEDAFIDDPSLVSYVFSDDSLAKMQILKNDCYLYQHYNIKNCT